MKTPDFSDISWIILAVMLAVVLFAGEPDIADAMRYAYLEWSGICEVLECLE